jgi:hypothetical protein
VITVFVWNMLERSGHRAGHAALLVQRTYISWWPEDRSDSIHWFRGGRFASFSAPSFNHTIKEDKIAEGRLPSYASPPIRCLNEQKILSWWENIRPKNNSCKISYDENENIAYDLTRMSCATIVYKALVAGGCIDIAGDISRVVSEGLTILSGAIGDSAGPIAGLTAGAVVQNVIDNAITPFDIQKYAQRLVSFNKN